MTRNQRGPAAWTARAAAPLAALAATAACLLLSPGAEAGSGWSGAIAGRVNVAEPPPPVERRPSVAALGMPEPRDVPDRRRSVVYLEAAPRLAFDDRTVERAVIDQRHEAFVPRVVAIMVGDIVDFPNSDPIFHNVFSLSRTRTFDLGRYAAGRSRSVRFDSPGIVRVFCDIHSHMSAFILVFSHPYFAVTDGDGRYRIEDVPPGRYDLAVWHETLPVDSQTIVVADGGVTEAHFTLGRP